MIYVNKETYDYLLAQELELRQLEREVTSLDEAEVEARELNETFAPLRTLVAQLEARIADSKPKGGFEFL